MTSEVGSGQIAFFPTFRGMRKAISAEVDGSTKDAGSRFTSGFKVAGANAGKSFGASFRTSTSSLTSSALKAATDQVAQSSRAVATARLRELDAAGKVRVAETGLAEARSKFAGDSSQVVRAEERLATAERAVTAAEGVTTSATNRLAASKLELASAANTASTAGGRLGNIFGRLPTTLGDSGSRAANAFKGQFIGVLGGVVGGNILTGIGFTIGHAINDGIQTGIGVGLNSIQLASDLNETTSAIRTVFGAASDDIIAFSGKADRALGQTRQEALLGAQTFGIFGKSAGLQGKPLSSFSTGLVSLAGDLASFYNTTPGDAIEALSAGLRGESEPLRRFGILLDDQTLRNKALTLGIYDGNGALTQQQRILAAQQVILQQSTIAQGDFAKTSGGLANQQRIFQASLQDTQAQLGTFFLPGATKVVTYANSTFLPTLGGIIDQVGPKLVAAFHDSAPAAKELLDQVGPLSGKFADLIAADLPGWVNSSKDDLSLLGDFLDILSGKATILDKFSDPKAGNGWLFDPASNGLKQSADELKDFFHTVLPGGLFGEGANAGEAAAQGVASGLGEGHHLVVAAGADAAAGFAGTFWGDTGKLAGTSAALGVGSGLGEGHALVVGAAKAANDAAAAQFSTEFWRQAGLVAAQGVGDGLGEGHQLVSDAGAQTAVAAIQGVDSLRGEFSASGGFWAQGLIDGMKAKLPAVDAAGASLGSAVSRATKRAMVINSPSPLAQSYTEFWGDGMVNGLNARQSAVEAAARSLAGAAVGATASSLTATGGFGAAVARSGVAPVYVQNPFTGEYLLAKAADVAAGKFDQKWEQKRTEVLAGGSV